MSHPPEGDASFFGGICFAVAEFPWFDFRVQATFFKYWLPVLAWMLLIFTFSGDSGSSQHSSRIIGPIVRWLKPDISEAALDRIIFSVRKTAHVTEYGILAALMWRARRKPQRADRRPWAWSDAIFAVALAALYAASDELHQAFVPNRDARVLDVVIDTSGAVLAMLIVWAWWRFRCRVTLNKNST